MSRITARFSLLAPASILLLLVATFVAGLAVRNGSLLAWVTAAAVAAVAVMAFAIALVAGRRAVLTACVVRRARRELHELLGVSESPRESHRLLIEHARRVLPGADAAVLVVGTDGAGLEPVLSEVVDQTPLVSINTVGVGPRSCLSIRLARSWDRRPGDSGLLACEICGAVAGTVACDPMIAGGEVIGSVLVGHVGEIDQPERAALAEAASRAAPTLVGQREVARSEERALADPLTGLPNRRAADEALRRMVAHAGRSLSPLGVVLLDLDRFRMLNDLHGSTHGDKALAAVGRLLASSVRASDFVARFGGEEFLLVLPDTDRHGCLELAEKLRRQIERTRLVHTGPITASLGVACLPDDAVDPERLLREADRALYMAKTQGRNRVHAADRGDRGDRAPET